jgi:hypothetical protein
MNPSKPKRDVGAAAVWRMRRRCRADLAARATHGCRLFPAQSRTRVPSPKNKGFCDAGMRRVEFSRQRCKLKRRRFGTSCIPSPVSIELRCERRYRLSDGSFSPVRFECHFAVTVFVAVIRFGANKGARAGKPVSRVPTQRSALKVEPTENSFMEQRLAMKIRSRLRVICATPVQKRSV